MYDGAFAPIFGEGKKFIPACPEPASSFVIDMKQARKTMPETQNNPIEAGRQFAFHRFFDAPRHLVFQAWVNPYQLAQWWGPEGFTNPVCELDVRPGGAIRIDMRGPDNVVYPMGGSYREITEPEHLVFTSAALDETGRPIFEVLNTASFSEADGETAFNLEARIGSTTPRADQCLSGMSEGWNQSLDRLAAFLRSF